MSAYGVNNRMRECAHFRFRSFKNMEKQKNRALERLKSAADAGGRLYFLVR